MGPSMAWSVSGPSTIVLCYSERCFTIETPLDNVVGGHITEHYRWYTGVGIRGSMVDDGLTFSTNRDRGVCLHFKEPIPRVIGRKPHSALTVTVADCDGLVASIGEA